MGAEQQKAGRYGLGSAFLWAAGQWVVCWFVTRDNLWPTLSALSSAFVAGGATAAILGRFARWGVGANLLMGIGLLVGVAVFSGSFSTLIAALDWWLTKEIRVDWEKLQNFLLSWAVAPPAALGALTGLYVRARNPCPGKS
jgi:hypothetical protein